MYTYLSTNPRLSACLLRHSLTQITHLNCLLTYLLTYIPFRIFSSLLFAQDDLLIYAFTHVPTHLLSYFIAYLFPLLSLLTPYSPYYIPASGLPALLHTCVTTYLPQDYLPYYIPVLLHTCLTTYSPYYIPASGLPARSDGGGSTGARPRDQSAHNADNMEQKGRTRRGSTAPHFLS